MRTEEEHDFGVDDAHVEIMLEEFNMSALKSTPRLRWERRDTDEKEMPWKRAKSLPTARWKTSMDEPS